MDQEPEKRDMDEAYEAPRSNSGRSSEGQDVAVPTSGYAIASLVLGICSIPACMCYGIPGLICGILGLIFWFLAKGQIARGERVGQGLALAGVICSASGIVITILFWVAVIVLAIIGASVETSTYESYGY